MIDELKTSRPYLRLLRIAWTASWGIAAVALCVLWARSYWRADFTHRSAPINIFSIDGRVLIGGKLETVAIRNPTPARAANPPKMNATSRLGFYSASTEGWVFTFADAGAAIPYWSCLLVVAAISAVVWLPRNFSLRTLLLAITLLSFLLGLVVWSLN